jgi:hypothetical protein
VDLTSIQHSVDGTGQFQWGMNGRWDLSINTLSGDDVTNGRSVDDLLNSGNGQDIFEFTQSSGNDYVDGFDALEDSLHFFVRDEDKSLALTMDSNGSSLLWGQISIALDGVYELNELDMVITYI